MPNYFAYGSALDRAHLTAWAQEHGHPADFLGEGLPAVLDDHALELTCASRYWGGGVGTLVPRVGAVVHGVLFELDEAALEIVRHKEGAVTGLFREITVEVQLGHDGDDTPTMQLLSASAFVASAPPAQVAPSARWLDSVIAGARAHGLPAAWIAELEAMRKP
jgi:gamma-glutamylcyclotransferase